MKILSLCITAMLLGGCTFAGDGKEEDPLFLYKGTNLSDHKYISSIINSLPYKDDMKSFSKYPDEKQITLRYDVSNKKKFGTILLTNATYLYCLTKDTEKIVFIFDDVRQTIYKEDVEKWYGNTDYEKAESQKELDAMIESSAKKHNGVTLGNL
ncbi:hypothetical protein Q7A53_20695 [Halobacillus rhizosphaerae]|uniref:hypothetical protein n=1 Tax=Halobacillus rhizosphaerae TaxID=3064889 RepID=UPI00398B0C57